jgi:ATP-dependent protease ClpP protease subunit
VGRFIEGIESQIRSPQSVSELRIEFSTCGGTLDSGEMFIRYINTLQEEGISVKLISYGRLYSMGSTIFLDANVSKYLTKQSVVVIHTPLIDARDRVKESRDMLNDVSASSVKEFLDKIKKLKILTKNEFKNLEEGRDIYLLAPRLNKWFTQHDINYKGLI